MSDTPKPTAPTTILNTIGNNPRRVERVAIATARGTILSAPMSADDVEKILDEIEEGITNPETDEETGQPLPEVYYLPVNGNRDQRIVLSHVITFGFANPHTDN